MSQDVIILEEQIDEDYEPSPEGMRIVKVSTLT